MSTVNEMLIGALSDIAPTAPWIIDEDDSVERELRRIVFDYSTVPETGADNRPIYDRYIIQVHYFCPAADDSVAVRKKIKKALYSAGFDYPSEISVGVDTQGDSVVYEQHYCFSTEYLEPIWAEDE